MRSILLATCLACSCATQTNDPNLVELSGALQNPFVQAKTPQELIARIRVGSKMLPDRERRPIHLALVIDTSGSMEGEAIANARRAAIELLESLSDGDRISLIAFHSTTELIAPATEIDAATRKLLQRKLEALEAKGTTDMTGGLTFAVSEFAGSSEETIRRVVLLSDGMPNDPTTILAIADQLAQQAAPVTALGLGLEFDETLLAGIAQRSGGKFHFVEDSKMVAGVFKEEVARLDRAVAKNATLELLPGPGVVITDVIGRSASLWGRGLQIPLGDVGESELRDIMVKLVVSPRANNASVELMDAVLSFDDASKDAGRLERRLYLAAKSTDDRKKIAESEDAEVSQSFAKQAAAALTIEALNEARLGNASGSQAILQRAEQVTRDNVSKYSDPQLQRALVDIVELQRDQNQQRNKRVYDNSMQLIY